MGHTLTGGQGFFSFSPTGQSLSIAANSGQGWMADGDVDGGSPVSERERFFNRCQGATGSKL